MADSTISADFKPGDKSRRVVISRVLAAPRPLVWKVWTDPKHLAQWWGPNGFTNPVCEWDARVGGAIRIHMRGPEGTPYDTIFPMIGVFREVVAPERLVFTNCPVDAAGKPTLEGLTTVTFAELGSKTRLTLETSAVAVVDYATRMLEGMEMGWAQSIDKLEELLKSL